MKSFFHRAMRPTQYSISRKAKFYIKEGKVKIAIVSKQGKEAVVALLGVDEFFGEGCLIGQPKRLAAAVTMSDCTIMRVGKNEIQRLLRDEPAFSEMFVSHILARKERVEEDLVDQLFNSTEKRLARLLLLLANFGKEGRPEPIMAKISQEVLADIRNDSVAREPFHEQVSPTRFHRLQRSP
jgi:CRP/FNR family transcriptional regulator, cyclic AMP receptor protein